MSWGTELWDQFENLSVHSQKSIDSCERFERFVKERCSIESDYAAKLKKLTKSYRSKKKDEEHDFTSQRGFFGMVGEIHDIAGQHEGIVENLTSMVLKDIQLLLQQLKQDRKKYLMDGSKQMASVQLQLAQLDKAKKQYEKAFREAEKAQDVYKKADADVHMSRAEVEKTKNAMVARQQSCEESKNEYASELQKTNVAQQQHFEVLMPLIFQQLQESDESRVTRVGSLLRGCADIERNILPIINTCIDGIIKASELVRAAEDSKMVIDKYKSGFIPPSDIAFEDLSWGGSGEGSGGGGGSNGNVNHLNNSVTSRPSMRSESMKGTLAGMNRVKKRSKLLNIFSGSKADENRDDFGHLPPNQQKKKLIQRIDSIKASLAKETAERDGMLKMQDVYKQNQALGDPQSLSKQLEENAQKLDKQRQLLQKYEGYLSEAELLRTSLQDTSWSSAKNASLTSTSHQGSLPPTPESTHHATKVSVVRAASDVAVNHHHVVRVEQRVPPPSGGAGGAGAVGPAHPQDHEGFDDLDDEFPAVGTCRALYAFDAPSEGSITMSAGEQFSIVEADQGDGWTRVRRSNGDEGFVPTTYVECRFYSQS